MRLFYPQQIDAFNLPLSLTQKNATDNSIIPADSDVWYALQQLQMKVGIDGSDVATSLDYRIAAIESFIEAGDFGSSSVVSGTGILTFNTLTADPQFLAKVNDTNVTLTISSIIDTHTFTMGWTGTLAAGRLNANVVQAITNDTNVTGSIAAQNLTLGWTGTLAAARLNANVVQSVINDTNVTGSISAQALTLGWTSTLAAARLNANVVQAITNDTNVTGSISAQNLTLGWTSTLAVARGGIGVGTLASNGVLYGNGTGAVQALAVNSTATNKFLTQVSSGVPAWATIAASDLPGSFSGFANPSGSVGLSAVNGSATTAMRSDGAPALSQAITPTWTNLHTFNGGVTIRGDLANLTFTGFTNVLLYTLNGTPVVSGIAHVADGSVLSSKGTTTSPLYRTVLGTTNQITVTVNSGNFTFSTPQDIATTSTPQFTRIGVGVAADASILALIQKDQNAVTELRIKNATTGNAAETRLEFISDAASDNRISVFASTVVAIGVLAPNSFFMYTDNSAGLAYAASHASGKIQWATGGTAVKMTLNSSGNLELIGKIAKYNNASPTNKKILIGDGTTYNESTPTFPGDASATSGKVIVSDGTNWIPSTPTFPNASATSGKITISDGTNWIASTPTFPNSSPLADQFIRGDGTNFVASWGTAFGSITSAPSGIANSETKILSSDTVMVASRLVAGTVIRIVIHGTCTSTAAGVGIFRVRYGTAGTTSDGILQAFTLGAAQTSGSAIPFFAEIIITIRTTGASATSDGCLYLVNQGTTGLSTTATQVIRGSATNINTTTASTYLTLTYISGNANTTTTFQDVAILIAYK